MYISKQSGGAKVDWAVCRRPSDTLVVQEIAKVRRQQKENDAAVAKLFRNKLPAGSSGLSDPADSAMLAGVTGSTMSSGARFYGTVYTWFLSLFEWLLSIIGIRMPDSTNPQKKDA